MNIANWWKYLGVILMLYTIVIGILVPIKSGILDYDNGVAVVGQEFDITVEAYNTHYKTSETKAYLLFPDDRLLKAKKVSAANDAQLTAFFDIPIDIEYGDAEYVECSIVTDNELDGYAQFARAVKIEKPSVSSSQQQGNWATLSELHSTKGFRFPFMPILYETIRNQFFHVAIWMAMFLLLLISCYHSVRYLIGSNLRHDIRSSALTSIALVFGIAGLLTGSMWARFTWGAWWTNDVKLNMTAIAMLLYFSYWILRSSITDVDSRARLSGVFNIFAFIALMILVMVIPRMTDSLHPGNGGNPGFAEDDLDDTLKAVFYPAVIAYTLIGLWIAQLYTRYQNISDKWELKTYNNSH